MKRITDEDGKVYILVPEEMYNETPERAKTGYERADIGDEYYVLNKRDIFSYYEDNSSVTYEWYKKGNYYNDRQLAEDNKRAWQIYDRMVQWQALNDVAVDIYNNGVYKYYIAYGCAYAGLLVAETTNIISSHAVYFSTNGKAEEALEIFRDDLIWLHTQYRRRLDEVRV